MYADVVLLAGLSLILGLEYTTALDMILFILLYFRLLHACNKDHSEILRMAIPRSSTGSICQDV